MQCQFCGATATVHLTDIASKKKRETHLCEGCARKHNLLPSGPGPQLNLQALLHLIMSQPAPGDSPPVDPSSLVCPACGIAYPQFRAEGRLGCPGDYDAFRAALEPLMERVHRDLTHAGKVPRTVRKGRRAADLLRLRDDLAAAVAVEQYEEAARLRDRIREKEAAE